MINLKKILCPVDLSKPSMQALKFANAIAGRYRASLLILHVMENPHADIPGSKTGAFSFGELLGLYKEERKEEIIDVLRRKDAPAVDFDIIFKEGTPYDKIVETAKETKTDMVILCACTGTSHEIIVGCTTERVVRLAPCPVLSVRTGGDSGKKVDVEQLHDLMDTDPKAKRKILLPTDFSEHSVLASKYSMSFAKEYKAEVIVMHVVESIAELTSVTGIDLPGYGAVMTYYDDMVKSAEKRVNEICQQMSEHGINVRDIVIRGNPRYEIPEIAESESVDLIVIGTHGRRGFSRLIQGSVAEAVVRHAQCSILSVKHPEHDFITTEQ